MKNALKPKLLLLFVLSLVFITSCKKENNYVDAIVEANCGGLFLRVDDKFLLVCNKEKLLQFESGQKVKASFKTVKNCETQDITCTLYAADKTIQIIDVKKQ